MICTVQLEPVATTAKQYPAVISGNTVNILPIQSNDTNYAEVVDIVPPSAETGRSMFIDSSSSVARKLTNVQTVTIATSVDPHTQSPIGSISGNQVNVSPIESNNSQDVIVSNKVTQVQVGDESQNRRSVVIDLHANTKAKQLSKNNIWDIQVMQEELDSITSED